MVGCYKFTFFEIFLYIASICMSALSLHIESTDRHSYYYRDYTDSIIVTVTVPVLLDIFLLTCIC